MDKPQGAVEPQEIEKDGITYEMVFKTHLDQTKEPLKKWPWVGEYYFEPGVGPYGVGEIRAAKDYQKHPIDGIRTIYRIKQ
jgi:hypothetical protein